MVFVYDNSWLVEVVRLRRVVLKRLGILGLSGGGLQRSIIRRSVWVGGRSERSMFSLVCSLFFVIGVQGVDVRVEEVRDQV